LHAAPSVAANITAISSADRPRTEASTIPDRRSRTRSRADLVILTSRSGSNDRCFDDPETSRRVASDPTV
jgi:hypothetical protein